MSKEVWEKAKAIIGTNHKLELGPYYASQALYAPRHLLFSLSRNKFASKMLPAGKNVMYSNSAVERGWVL